MMGGLAPVPVVALTVDVGAVANALLFCCSALVAAPPLDLMPCGCPAAVALATFVELIWVHRLFALAAQRPRAELRKRKHGSHTALAGIGCDAGSEFTSISTAMVLSTAAAGD